MTWWKISPRLGSGSALRNSFAVMGPQGNFFLKFLPRIKLSNARLQNTKGQGILPRISAPTVIRRDKPNQGPIGKRGAPQSIASLLHFIKQHNSKISQLRSRFPFSRRESLLDIKWLLLRLRLPLPRFFPLSNRPSGK